ncbi:MAG: NAD-dependent dihydropyrimidine dehydrogenase subunit PreA, partial [Mogibacterium sp.]|nr:NAD-dependent dihydropyrimidine dehydrogenase subunit PreA [Mogibacterium sp.]
MDQSVEKFVSIFDKSEVSKCMICLDPPCTKACPQHADVGNILRSLYFRNYIGAINQLNCDCMYCNAPCQKACVLEERNTPVEIREVLMQVKENAGILPKSKIAKVDLSTDICGIKLENPFLLSSSVVASSYDMCRRAFEAGWAGASFKTICNFPQHETSPRFSAIRHHSNAFCGFKNIEQLSDHSVEENMQIFEKLREDFPTKVIVASIMGQNE